MRNDVDLKLENKTPIEREDIIKSHFLSNIKRRKVLKKQFDNPSSVQSSFSFQNNVKLNKGVVIDQLQKKHLLEEERNTEIERSNRILHQKLTKCAPRSKTYVKNHHESTMCSIDNSRSKRKSKKIKTSPTLPLVNRKYDISYTSRIKGKQKQAMTLFFGNENIDGIHLKIKIAISESMYYLIAQNEKTKIVLQMRQDQYWPLHYKELEENPCNIFQFLKIDKGEIKFRIKDSHQNTHQRNIDYLNGRKESKQQKLNVFPKI